MTLIAFLLEIETSSLRELQWSVDWWGKQYAEAGYRSEIVWKLYIEAIDNAVPKEYINTLFELATMFDAISKECWSNWQNAKAQYLAMLN